MKNASFLKIAKNSFILIFQKAYKTNMVKLHFYFLWIVILFL